ncbi:MAG: sel1 repeat family protein [Rhodospirillales bacterium]|nr:sel1 repeat family protein [Rhodospirillales bacterium]
MKIIITLLLILLCAPSFSHADYLRGKDASINKDYKTAAMEWSDKISEESPNSLYRLGLLNFKGRGVPEDKDRAYELFKKAADMGLSNAQYALWNIEKRKAKTKAEKELAVGWLLKAAQQGNAKAQYSLGLTYGAGNFLEKDNLMAYSWLERAVMNGIGEAEKDLRVIKKRLTPQGAPVE